MQRSHLKEAIASLLIFSLHSKIYERALNTANGHLTAYSSSVGAITPQAMGGPPPPDGFGVSE